MFGGKEINWMVDPDTYAPYLFVGHIYITKNGKAYQTYNIRGVSALGKGVSDTFAVNWGKGTYKITMTGVATATTGRKLDIFTVSKNANITVTLGGGGR